MQATTRQALPATVQAALSPALSLRDAETFTRKLTHDHYENFLVVSHLLPKHLRQDFCNVYAFCRIADDLGDELGDTEASIVHLNHLKLQTRQCFAGEFSSNLFIALSATLARHPMPIDPFLDLIDAFEQDQTVTRYETFEQLLDYCRRSANPVGRIVLYLCGYADATRQQLSDYTCTALQLANFWQDVRRDYTELGRVYLPQDSMQKFAVTEDQIRRADVDQNYRDLIRFEVDRTESLFAQGDALPSMLDGSIAGHIALFSKGGRAILQSIRDQDYDTLSSRPSLSSWQKARLLMSAVGARFSRGRKIA